MVSSLSFWQIVQTQQSAIFGRAESSSAHEDFAKIVSRRRKRMESRSRRNRITAVVMLIGSSQ